MISVPGYRELDLIYESANSLVFRSRRVRDDLPVVLKLLKDDFPSPDELVRYRQEYKITSLLQGQPGIIKTHGAEDYKNTLFIVLEDFGAESLRHWMEHRDFTLQEKLSLSIRMAECLQTVHQAQIIHKDINPANFVYNPETDTLKIIDFGISTQLTRECMELRSPHVLEGTLLYISPEQTGRMNRSVDYRTDYYSLGMTFYQLFTGRLPFRSEDPMELVHCHIAHSPPPPLALVHDLPVPISELILKLLSKTAEDRYQSPWGLLADLRECLDQVTKGDSVVAFSLGRQDIPERLLVPQKLYGRENDATRLQERFEEVCRGQKELTLVAGPSGVGKTALVQELFRPLTLHRGHFVSGKFDLLQRDRPYTAFVNALKQLVRQLLTETEEGVARWRGQILAAVGRNGQVIVNLLPEIERIIGPQPELPELEPTENLNRFNLVFQDFLTVFCQPEHPLVMFIDDLQWADASSLKLLKLILTAQDIRCLQLIGAYRDNEVHPAHPFVRVVKELRELSVQINELVLSPLDLHQSTSLLAETLHCGAEVLADLAELIQDKTHGNPFFVNAFLNTLHAEGVLWLDRASGIWMWDLAKIRTLGITDNVAELMVQNVQKLPENTRRAMSLAACVGNCFDLETLALICDTPANRLLATLAPALNMGQVIPLSSDYKAVEHGASLPTDRAAVQFKFAHDRLQQAAYSLIPESDRADTHWRIGKLLQKKQGTDQQGVLIFDIANHLNVSAKLLDSRQERAELSRVNLAAGKQAKSSTAYEQSLQYLVTARELVSESDWESGYDHMLAVCEQGAEAAYLSTDFALMKRFIQEVQLHARTSLDKTGVVCVSIAGETAQRNPEQAIRTGIAFLQELGVEIPFDPSRFRVILALLKIHFLLRREIIEKLLDLPEMINPEKSAALRVTAGITSAAYFCKPNVTPLLSYRRLQILLTHGNHDWSGSTFAGLGMIFCGYIGDIDRGYRLGEIALQSIERRVAFRQKCRVMMMVNVFVKHWKDHLGTTIGALQEAYEIGLETGEFDFSATAAHNHCHNRFLSGNGLQEVADAFRHYSDAVGKIKQDIPLCWNRIFLQCILNLQGLSTERIQLAGPLLNETEVTPVLIQKNERTGLCALYFNKMLLSCLFQQYEQTVDCIEFLGERLAAATSIFMSTRFRFLESIARLGLCTTAGRAARRRHLRKVAANQRRFKRWARFAPCNHLHVYELVEAERCRVLGRIKKATHHYEQAIAAAKENRFLHEEAMAYELAGLFYLGQGDQTRGRSHLHQARYAYQKWGATAKVADMDERHGALLSMEVWQAARKVSVAITTTAPSCQSSTAELDLASVIKASQGISGEIEIEKLLEKMMKILIETAGAQNGALILQGQDEVRVEALIEAGEEPRFRLVSTLLEQCPEVSNAIALYVLHSGENLVLGDALTRGDFAQDPYVLKVKARSVLCCPIQSHGRIMGALYLENNRAVDAFTPERVELLGLLASQAAISIENARLYDKLQQAFMQAEESMRIKDEFLLKTSHELRTPLNAIINLPQGMLERFSPNEREIQCNTCLSTFELEPGEQLTPELICPACQRSGSLDFSCGYTLEGNPKDMVQALKVVEANGRKLHSIVEDLLAISDISKGDFAMDLARVNLAELLREVEHEVKPQAQQQGVELAFGDDSEDIFLMADRKKLYQVFKNLIDNAIKFSRNGGKVAILEEPGKDEVQVTVEDQGIGIAQEHQAMIFQGFRQASGGTTRTHGGMGLGLTVAKSYVELHGGTIWVESELGKGSTFHVLLPLRGRDSPN